MEEYTIMGKMVSIAVIFYIFGWLFRASKMEKKVLISNEELKTQLQEIYSSFKQEVEFAQIERDNHQLRQAEQLKTIEKFSKTLLEARAVKKVKEENEIFEHIKNI